MAIKGNFIKRIKEIIEIGQRRVLIKAENDKETLNYYLATIYKRKDNSGFKIIRKSRINVKEAMTYL